MSVADNNPADVNPYQSPSQPSAQGQHPASLAERLKCPVCAGHSVPFWKLYWWIPLFSFSCPTCAAKLRVAKYGFGRWSSFLIAIPSGIAIAVVAIVPFEEWFQDWLGNVPVSMVILVIIFVLAGCLAADYLVDRQYAYVRAAKAVGQRSAAAAPENENP